MMAVNRVKIRLPLSGTSELAVPVSLDYQLVDQNEVVERKFVDEAIEDSINPILDYEKVRFRPIIHGSSCLNPPITYNLNFLNSNNSAFENSTYGSIGFSDEDIKFRKNAFMKSFLRLSFYDTDIGTNQRLLFFVTLFPVFIQSKKANRFNVRYILNNPKVNRANNGEGYFLYYFKDEVPKEVFMRATFNNAKTGEVISMMASNSLELGIDELAISTMDNPFRKNNLYTKYVLGGGGSSGYYYYIDKDYSDDNVIIDYDACAYTINLYQVFAV